MFIYDMDLTLISEVDMPEGIQYGWGITHDNHFIYISDGSSTLYLVDLASYKVLSKVTVLDINGKTKVSKLNELEMVGEYIYANTWMSNNIYKIAKSTG